MPTFTGKQGTTTYVAMTLRRAIELYAKHGIKANRMYTPTNMLKRAGDITGHTYKRGQYEQAMRDLTAWIAANGAMHD